MADKNLNIPFSFTPETPLKVKRNLIGEVFNRLTVINYGRSLNRRGCLWLCQCQCGQYVVASTCNLTSKNTQSCGCYSKELTTRNRTHYASKHPLYAVWRSMIGRCHNPKHISFERYGARGITVCDRWRVGTPDTYGFLCFLADMGERPSKNMSLDRVNNNGNYEPSNVKWSNAETQNNNRRSSVFVTYRGETHTLAEWGRIVHIPLPRISARLKAGWSVEKTLTLPPSRKRPGERPYRRTSSRSVSPNLSK